MEILYTEYRCASCGCGVENLRSVYLDVPCKLDVACPECNGTLELSEVRRMVSDDSSDEEDI